MPSRRRCCCSGSSFTPCPGSPCPIPNKNLTWSATGAVEYTTTLYYNQSCLTFGIEYCWLSNCVEGAYLESAQIFFYCYATHFQATVYLWTGDGCTGTNADILNYSALIDSTCNPFHLHFRQGLGVDAINYFIDE